MDEKLLARRIEDVEEVTGSGTAMVSLYISSGTSLSSEKQRMSQEKSEAANIKSKQNRKNVEKAIDRVNDLLKNYKQTPENGLILFVGVTEEGTEEFVFDNLPQPLEYSDYTCDSKFHTEPLREMVAPDHTIGLLVVERGGCAIGELRGTSIRVHYDEESNVMGKHNAGGQSAERFDRLIEEQRDNYFSSIRTKLEDLFVDDDNQPTVDGFILGGTQVTVDNFVSDGYLPQPLQDVKIGGSYSIDIANRESLGKLVDKATDEIDSVAKQEEREYVDQFFQALHSNSDSYATYGKEMIDKALDYGAVNSILISENRNRDEITQYQEKVENQGGELIVVSDDFSEGQQFWKGFNGLGALLRYQIE
jgi:peptide chain release factor subunit 1